MVQLATVALVLLAPPNLQGISLLRLIVPLLVIGFVAAFWFSSLAHLLRKDELHKADKAFAKEREKIKVSAERAKTRVVKQAQKEVAKEARNTHAKANFKVGATFAAAIGVGALMLLTQFLTIGLLMMTTSGGALAGYLYRGRKQTRAALPSDNDSNAKLIEAKSITKLLPPLLKRDKQKSS
jgi:uncharacterized membrane protein YbhN (UPF0104 family)